MLANGLEFILFKHCDFFRAWVFRISNFPHRGLQRFFAVAFQPEHPAHRRADRSEHEQRLAGVDEAAEGGRTAARPPDKTQHRQEAGGTPAVRIALRGRYRPIPPAQVWSSEANYAWPSLRLARRVSSSETSRLAKHSTSEQTTSRRAAVSSPGICMAE